MRAYQVFATMPAERAVALMRALREQSPGTYTQALAVASAAFKARPVYLARQPFEKQAEATRRALSRVAANAVAEELLATYFLECRRPLLLEWLDKVGVAHEEGTLQDERPVPPSSRKLREAVATFLDGPEPPERELLLRAFAAQEAIDWPELDALVEGSPGSR
jgi:hypothetical protein